MPNISIEPESKSLGPGETCAFKASTGSEAAPRVTWQVVSPQGTSTESLGTIDTEGLYCAPQDVAAQTEVVIRATADGESATAVVTLTPKDAPVESTPESSTADTTPVVAPAIKVKPEMEVVGTRQTVKFQAVDASEKSVTVSWSLSDPDGLGPEKVGKLDPTSGDFTTYTAPAEILSQRYLTITAMGAGSSDKAFIALAPGKVTVIQSEVTLRAGERQVFQALVSGDSKAEVTWAAPSPSVGAIDEKGEYTAPSAVPEDQTVIITAVAKVSGDKGHARVSLLADPWTGRGPNVLGFGLLALFVVAVFVYSVWPPPLDQSKLNAALAAQTAAERVLEQRKNALTEAKDNADRLANKQAENQRGPADTNNPAVVQAANLLNEEKRIADENVQKRTVELNLAAQDLKDKQAALEVEQANFKLAKTDEQHLFLLVVLAGALGAFVHVTRSFVDFIGNRRLRPSWIWWYVLQPFTGAALAVVVYLVIRGGFFMGASAGTNLNPFGFIAVASLVGLFSKQATNKLDELFTTMFKTDKERELKDKLNPSGSAGRVEQ